MSDYGDDYVPPPPLSPRRRDSAFTFDQLKRFDAEIPEKAKEVWTHYSNLEQFDVLRHSPEEVSRNEQDLVSRRPAAFKANFVKHVETTQGRNMYNCDNFAAYQAASTAVRSAVTVNWANTQQRQSLENNKRIYYLSLEFLMGRAMDNALINNGARGTVKDSLNDLGFRLEDVLEQEDDAGLGNGGLGRLAACFVDSLSSRNYNGWGYGLNYQYGIFRQAIVNGFQVELPDNWLKNGSAWEIVRREVEVPVRFYGHVVDEVDPSTGKVKKVWEGGDVVLAMGVDFPIPGYHTPNCNNLRLWQARPTPEKEFDFAEFNAGDYAKAVSALQRAEAITDVLYPNDNFADGKRLRLTQQYFWVCASVHDIVARFRKHGHDWSEMPDYVAIQLNDTHPTLAVVELQRVLIDEHGLEWEEAWDIVRQVFAYTNHTVMQEALEKWPLDLVERLLPRHMQIIFDINYFFLQEVSKKFPNNSDMLRDCSIIEEGPNRQVRMAYLAVIASHKVNGVAELHSQLVKTDLFPQFVKFFGDDHFTNVTNGVTPRRWLQAANPMLADLIGKTLKDPEHKFLLDLNQLKKLDKYANDLDFLKQWDAVKTHNKRRLARLVFDTTGVIISPRALFDVQVKRIHEYKRQQLNIFAVIWRYLEIKRLRREGLSTEEIATKHFVPKAAIIGGKAAPGYFMAKTIIHLVNAVAEVVNNDTDIDDLLKVAFVPDYNVSKAEILCPGSDLSNHISTAGTEGSGTSNMKFALNGGLILGTLDGANVEITREIGDDNIFIFGVTADQVPGIREKNAHGVNLPTSLLEVFNAIDSGLFGSAEHFRPLLDSTRFHGDYYLVATDFEHFLAAHRKVEACYGRGPAPASAPATDSEAYLRNWVSKSVHTTANMGYFSSDRAVDDYAKNIWGIEPRF